MRLWLAIAALLVVAVTGASQPALAGQVRQYYIAADEVDWNYMPTGQDGMMGMAPMGYAKFYATRGPHLNGPVYRKAIYREYTDATFAHLKPRPASEAYLGILGPVIHAEVGDSIHIHFKNNGTHPYSMHPHGVFYEKASEGSPYADGVPMSAKGGDSVAPGKTFDYVWEVPERAGPGPRDPSSIVWLYHSHVDERKDTNSGLAGTIIVTAKGKAKPDGSPKGIDHEFVALFLIYDENQSLFTAQNTARFIGDPKGTDLSKNSSLDPSGVYDPELGTGPGAQNFRSSINGFQFANGPAMTMKKGDHVRWYVVTLGFAFNFHTPHWHGNTVLVNGQRTDVLNIAPAQMITADMVPDAPGSWLFHCHVSDHMDGGMVAMYKVLP